ncbi:MAG: hypothetical protein HYZ42_13775, partial [Bacteroidetes bacterium]|nr:hypothetical protein [Bacteroidota bacterium]
MSENQQSGDNSNSSSNKNKKPGKFPQINFYWFYGLIVIIFLIITFFPTQELKEINKIKLSEMIKNHDVSKVDILVYQGKANIYLTEQATEKEEYKKYLKDFAGSKNKGPHYTLPIYGDPNNIEVFIKDTQKEYNYTEAEKIPVEANTDKDYSGSMLTYLIYIALFIGLWVVLFRRMGMQGGPGSQIFNIGKSKATLFDKDTKVN